MTVVSQELAHFFWPGEDPIGKQMLDGNGNALDVVGVARETTSGPFDSGVGQFYVLKGRRQSGEAPHSNELLVRFSGDPGVLQQAIRNVATDVDRGILIQSQTLAEELAATGRSLWPVTVTVLFLGGAGAVLALIGVYGVVAFSVSRSDERVRRPHGARRQPTRHHSLGRGWRYEAHHQRGRSAVSCYPSSPRRLWRGFRGCKVPSGHA